MLSGCNFTNGNQKWQKVTILFVMLFGGNGHSRLTPKRGGILELDLNAFNLFGQVLPADWILSW